MDTRAPTSDRRSFLASAPAVAVVAAMPSAAIAPTGNRTAWDAAMKAHVAAQAEFDAYGPILERFYEMRRKEFPPLDSNLPGKPLPTDPQFDAAQDHFEELGDRLSETDWELMQMPSPDMAALRWKLDKLLNLDEGQIPFAWSSDYAEQTVADYRRILGPA